LKQLQANAGAVHDLTTDSCKQFNIDTPDVKDVRYFEIAGDAPQDDSELLLFDLAAEIGKIKGPNDGVVTVESAQRPGRKLLDIWPVDHAAEIGWSKAILNVLHPFRAMEAFKEHLARYDAIVAVVNTATKGAGLAEWWRDNPESLRCVDIDFREKVQLSVRQTAILFTALAC
jgi:hypothetical protein